MKHCRDCIKDVHQSNKLWTATCFIVGLFGLGAGFLLGQMSVLM